MIPSVNVRKLLGGILARYQEMFKIELFAYFFLGNHFHLIARAPEGNMDSFCENVNREISRRMNWKFGRQGRFWSRRYDDIPIGNEDDLLEAFLYVTTNATRHGLLEDSSEWPGLHSYDQALDEKKRYFTFYHYSSPTEESRCTRHELKLSVLPQFSHLTHSERRIKLEKLLVERMRRYVEDRIKDNKGFLGIEKLSALPPGEIPKNVSRSKRPVVYSKCLETWRHMRDQIRLRISQYREASYQYRLGNRDAVFPPFCFFPPLHRIPKIPFGVLVSN